MTNLTAQLGSWVSTIRYADLPEDVVAQAKLCFLDAIGCGLFGSQLEWGRISGRVSAEMSGAGPSSVWGQSTRLTPAGAALANGTAVHGFEMDDVHLESMIHPGSVVIPTALALAESERLSGQDLLTSIVAGYEVGIRVGIAAGAPHVLRGFHPTGTVGAVAAAAAAGRALALDPSTATHCLGLGATQASGLYAARTSGMAKRFHAGRAAQSGVIAGLMSRAGLTAAEDALAEDYGGFLSTMSDGVRATELVQGLGSRWDILNVGFKAYASCASTHTTIDALDLMARQGLGPHNLVELDIGMTQVGVNNVGWPYKPAGALAAQMNGFYAAAVKLAKGKVSVAQFEDGALRDPDVLGLMDKIHITHDPSLDATGTSRHAVNVTALLSDGRRLDTHVENRRGGPSNPLSRAEVEAKFFELSGVIIAEPDARKLVLSIEHLEDVPSMAAWSSAIALQS